MLASMSEGRNCEELEEASKRGTAVNCKVSKDDVEKALQLQTAEAVCENEAEDQKRIHVAKKVLQSANLAVSLSNLIKINQSKSVNQSRNITKLQWTAKANSSSAQKWGL